MKLIALILITLAPGVRPFCDVGGPVEPPTPAPVVYVSPSGSGSNSGTSCVDARSLASFNATAGPGDTCELCPGNYGDPIAPANAGTSDRPIEYIGSIADPEGAVVQGITIAQPDVHVSYVKSDATVSVTRGAGLRTRLHRVTVDTPSSAFTWQGQHCYAESLSVKAFGLLMTGTDGNYAPVGYYVQRDTMVRSRLDLNTTSGTRNVYYIRTARDLVFEDVDFIVQASGGEDYQLVNHYNVQNSRFTRCTWDIENHVAPGKNVKFAFNNRDSTRGNVFENGIVYVRCGSGAPADIILSNSGSLAGTVGWNTYDGMVFLHEATSATYGAGLKWQNQARNDVMINSIVASLHWPALSLDFAGTGTRLEHNTFASFTPRVVLSEEDPFWTGGSGHVNRRNIIWSVGPGTGSRDYPLVIGSNGTPWTENLIYAAGGDPARAVWANGAGRTAESYDADSRWSDPSFTGSPISWGAVRQALLIDGTNPFALKPGSGALGSHWTDGYVGASRP